MPRVTPEHRAARRDQILAAAVRCAAREGFHKTTMAHVIEESGLSAGAVYGYFKGKSDLIRAIAETVVGSLAHSLDEVADGPGPVTLAGALEHALAQIAALSAAQEGPFPLVALHAWSEAARDEEVRHVVDVSIDGVAAAWLRVLDRAVADGTLAPEVDRASLVPVLLGLMPGFVLQSTLLGRVDAQTYLAGFVALTTAGTGASGGDAPGR